MSWSVPIIYAPQAQAVRLPAGSRLLAMAIAVGCFSVLALAAWLQPDPSGMGTHTQLRLTACQFAFRTGIPCPTCGMTTSFAFLAHGKLLSSLWAQPMGTLLAFLDAMVFWAAGYIAISGRPAHRLLRYAPTSYLLIGLLSLAVLAWAWKIYIHLHGMDGWGL